MSMTNLAHPAARCQRDAQEIRSLGRHRVVHLLDFPPLSTFHKRDEQIHMCFLHRLDRTGE
jgi:hypothetical protein